MVLRWDARKDFFIAADGWERVRVAPVRPGQPLELGSSGQQETEAYLVNALRGPISQQEAGPSGGQYTATDVIWHLAADGLPEPPQPGALVIDGQGRRFRVLQTSQLDQTGRYRCVCRYLAIEAGLDTLVDIERAQPSKGPDGVEVLQWRLWRSGVRAKLQAEESRVQMEGDQMVSCSLMKIYFAEPVLLDQHCRIRGPDGVRYRILTVRGQERIDGLMEAEVEPI